MVSRSSTSPFQGVAIDPYDLSLHEQVRRGLDYLAHRTQARKSDRVRRHFCAPPEPAYLRSMGTVLTRQFLTLVGLVYSFEDLWKPLPQVVKLFPQGLS